MEQDMEGIVLSGMRPTDSLHIGHFEGVLREWVKLQEQNKCYYFVADWHAITTNSDTKNIKDYTVDIVTDWLAFGVDPEKSTVFIQSQIPQHAELHLDLSMLVNLGRLERLPTFIDYLKEIIKIDETNVTKFNEEKRAKVNYGFLGYPVLQTADILMYKTTKVPIGEDQKPHLELTQELAKRFNHIYGNIFPIPEAVFGKTPRILGTDGRKMSKSYGNVIMPTDSLEKLSKGIKTMVTDTDRKSIKEPGNPYNCSVFDLQEVYDAKGAEEIGRACREAELGCKDCKETLAPKIHKTYEKFRERKSVITKDYVLAILHQGSKKAREIAKETMKEVKEVMLMDYRRE